MLSNLLMQKREREKKKKHIYRSIMLMVFSRLVQSLSAHFIVSVKILCVDNI